MDSNPSCRAYKSHITSGRSGAASGHGCPESPTPLMHIDRANVEAGGEQGLPGVCPTPVMTVQGTRPVWSLGLRPAHYSARHIRPLETHRSCPTDVAGGLEVCLGSRTTPALRVEGFFSFERESARYKRKVDLR